MIRTLQEMTCDCCGTVQSFVIFTNHSTPMEATLKPADMIEEYGWTKIPVENATKWRFWDRCPRCTAMGTKEKE